MAYKQYTFAGLDKPLYIPDWIKVETKLIKHSRFYSNQYTRAQTRTTWHDTGNPNSSADSEWQWAGPQQRSGAGVGGYNGIYDDEKIIISQLFDSVVWAQGTPVGNATSYAFEQAWGAGANFQKTLEVGAALHAAIIVAKGWDVDKALVQHNFWTGKHCPGQIRNKGLWTKVVQMVKDNVKAIKAEIAKGTAPTTTPKPTTTPAPAIVRASPIKELVAFRDMKYGLVPAVVPVNGVDYIHTRDVVVSMNEITEYKYADKSSVIKKAPAKTQYIAEFIFFYQDEYWYYTSEDTRILVAGTARVSDTPTQEDQE